MSAWVRDRFSTWQATVHKNQRVGGKSFGSDALLVNHRSFKTPTLMSPLVGPFFPLHCRYNDDDDDTDKVAITSIIPVRCLIIDHYRLKVNLNTAILPPPSALDMMMSRRMGSMSRKGTNGWYVIENSKVSADPQLLFCTSSASATDWGTFPSCYKGDDDHDGMYCFYKSSVRLEVGSSYGGP